MVVARFSISLDRLSELLGQVNAEIALLAAGGVEVGLQGGRTMSDPLAFVGPISIAWSMDHAGLTWPPAPPGDDGKAA